MGCCMIPKKRREVLKKRIKHRVEVEKGWGATLCLCSRGEGKVARTRGWLGAHLRPHRTCGRPRVDDDAASYSGGKARPALRRALPKPMLLPSDHQASTLTLTTQRPYDLRVWQCSPVEIKKQHKEFKNQKIIFKINHYGL